MAKPKLALIPAAQGTKLYSVLPSDGTGDFTFTRGSVATRINAQGLIENVASGQSRLDYPLIDGVQKGCPHHILEPARTNVIQYSEDFSNSVWDNSNQVTRTANATISPDGTLNAFNIKPTNVNSNHTLRAQNLGGFSNGAVVSVSFFAKQNGYKYISVIGGFGSSNTPSVIFNLEDGLIESGTGTIENYGNGWYRCIAPITLNSTLLYCVATILNDNLLGSFVGDNVKGVYVYGFQIEQGSYPTSYIPTNGTAVTRSAETATGAGNSTTFNDSEGVLMAEISALADDGTFRMIGVFDEKTTNEDRIQIYYRNDANKISFLIEENNVNQFVKTLDVTTIQYNKVALKYGNTSKVYINGFKLAEESGVAIPNNLQRLSFNEQNGSNNFYGNTKQVQYFNSALADTQLEQLTSWQSFRDMANGQLYTIE